MILDKQVIEILKLKKPNRKYRVILQIRIHSSTLEKYGTEIRLRQQWN